MKNRNQSVNSNNNKYSNNFIFLLFIFSLNIFMTSSEINNYVYFPLKRKDNSFLNNIKNITEIMKFIYLEPLVSELTLGNPEQKSNIIFRTDCTYIYLTSSNHNTSHPDQVKDFIQSKYGNFEYFNEDNSNSICYYEKIYNFHEYEYYNQYFTKCVSENVKINKNNIKLDLMLSKSIKYEEPGAICLQISEEDNTVLQFTASFPVLLKRNYSLINNYKWFIYYGQKKEKDYLVLGTSVKEFKNPETGNNLYAEYDILAYDNTDDSLEVHKAAMTMEFDDIYLVSHSNKNDKDLFEDKQNFKGRLIPNIGFIVGTTNYSQYLEKNIFRNYLDSGKCHKSLFSQRPNLVGEEYSYYYCDETLYDNIKKLFKKIVFKQIDLYENFELTFYDLFMKKNGYLIFLVIFSTHMHKNWDLGTPFLKKYQFDFDFENLKIGYYHLSKKKENKKNFLKYILYFFVILVLSGILNVLGIIIGKNYFILRKKRANELDDDFEYDEKEQNNSPILTG